MLAERDDRVVHLVDFRCGQREAERLAARLHGMASRVATEDEARGSRLPDVLGPHDFIGARVLQHAVLMDAGLVRERVAPDDRLVGLHRLVGDLSEQLARREQLGRVDRRVVGHPVLTHAQRHHELFERCVARAFADAVHRALHLPHAALNRGQAVGHGQTEIVVAMRAEHRFRRVRHAGDDLLEELTDLVRRRVADRVGQVDGRGAGVDDPFDHAAQKITIAPRRIFRRELHIVGERSRQLHRFDGGGEAIVVRHPQLRGQVQVGGRKKRVNARSFCGRQRLAGLLDVLPPRPRERGDHRAVDGGGNLPHGFGVGRRGDGEAGLDDVDPERVERARHGELRRHVHRETRRLLSVAQGGVEDDDACRSRHGFVVTAWPVEVKVIIVTQR